MVVMLLIELTVGYKSTDDFLRSQNKTESESGLIDLFCLAGLGKCRRVLGLSRPRTNLGSG